MSFRVERQGYSRNPWRVLDGAGAQVFRREIFEHPNLGDLAIDGPVCFSTKREAVTWVAAQEGGD